MATQKPSDSNLNSNLNNIHAREVTPDEVAYRDGYVQGQASEQQYQYTREQISESNGTANGMLIGLAFAALIGIGAGAFFYITRSNEPVQTQTASPTPATSQPQQPQQRTTIIERTIDRTKEVVPTTPDVQISVPAPQPSQETAPAPEPANEAAPADSNPIQNPIQESQPQSNTAPNTTPDANSGAASNETSSPASETAPAVNGTAQ
ncbi:hypothetical protein IFO70_27275 [Phormidium tenue FACHB-886]|nr:hypothetical protein [Phormidium tenue FACHB-886]